MRARFDTNLGLTAGVALSTGCQLPPLCWERHVNDHNSHLARPRRCDRGHLRENSSPALARGRAVGRRCADRWLAWCARARATI